MSMPPCRSRHPPRRAPGEVRASEGTRSRPFGSNAQRTARRRRLSPRSRCYTWRIAVLSGGGILPTRVPAWGFPGAGCSTAVSACSRKNPRGPTVSAWVTSTSVPGPRHEDTISFNPTTRTALPRVSGRRDHDVSTEPTAINWPVSRQRHIGEDTIRSTRTPRWRKPPRAPWPARALYHPDSVAWCSRRT